MAVSVSFAIITYAPPTRSCCKCLLFARRSAWRNTSVDVSTSDKKTLIVEIAQSRCHHFGKGYEDIAEYIWILVAGGMMSKERKHQ